MTPPVNPVVEAMCRAAAEADAGGLRAHGINADIKPWRVFLPEITAALQALADTITPEMVEAGSAQIVGIKQSAVGAIHAKRIFRAMILAALNPTTNQGEGHAPHQG